MRREIRGAIGCRADEAPGRVGRQRPVPMTPGALSGLMAVVGGQCRSVGKEPGHPLPRPITCDAYLRAIAGLIKRPPARKPRSRLACVDAALVARMVI